MKKTISIIILFLVSYIVRGQYIVSTGEYLTLALDTATHQAYQVSSVATPIAGLPPAKSIFAGAHHEAVVSITGDSLFLAGDNTYGQLGQGNTSSYSGFVRVTQDSAGNAWPGTGNSIVQVWLGTPVYGGDYGWNTSALLSNGTVWTWGSTIGSLRGSGTSYTGSDATTRPVQVVFPGNPMIVKFFASTIGCALDNLGNVYTWGGQTFADLYYTQLGQGTTTPNYNTPTKINLPAPAKDITGGVVNFVLLTNGSLYGWGPFIGSLGVGYGNGPAWYATPYGGAISPILLDTALNFPHPVTQIASNNSGTYAILSDGSLWFWGDNALGCGGNGTELNFATYSPPYNWNQAYGQLGQRKPVQIAPGARFAGIFANNNLCYYAYASDQNGNLYSFGRGKSGCLGNQIVACDNILGGINATYPNAFDVPWITPIDMTAFWGTTTYTSTCPLCITSPSGSPCSNCTNPPAATVNPVLSINVINNNTIVLNSSASTNTRGYHFSYRLFTQTAGTPVNMKVQAGITDTLYNVANGTYGFTLKLIDNNWDSASVSSSITVNYYPPSNYILQKRAHKKLFVQQ